MKRTNVSGQGEWSGMVFRQNHTESGGNHTRSGKIPASDLKTQYRRKTYFNESLEFTKTRPELMKTRPGLAKTIPSLGNSQPGSGNFTHTASFPSFLATTTMSLKNVLFNRAERKNRFQWFVVNYQMNLSFSVLSRDVSDLTLAFQGLTYE